MKCWKKVRENDRASVDWLIAWLIDWFLFFEYFGESINQARKHKADSSSFVSLMQWG